MLPARQQQALIDRFGAIEDLHERLALLVDRVRQAPGLPAELKTDTARVPGCVSRVWLVPRLEGGRCHFQLDADSTLVRGLAALLCEMYEGATPEEVAAFEPELLERLGVAATLSPTRRHGLAQVRKAIRDFALQALAT